MKKYPYKHDKTDTRKKHKWSDGFTNKKNGDKKEDKPKKGDVVEFEDDTVVLVDEDVEVDEILGDVMIFVLKGRGFKVAGKSKV